MTWKIKEVNHSSNPCIHMVDPSVDLHMRTDIIHNETDVWIGADEPEDAALHVKVLYRCGKSLERVSPEVTRQQIRIINNVLRTMGRLPLPYLYETVADVAA